MINIVSNAKSLYVTTTLCSTLGGLVRLAIVRIAVIIWRVNRPELNFYDFYFFMILRLEFLNFFSRCVYFDLAIRVLITTVSGHTASFHACSMLVPTIPKSMEASSTVTTYLELSWCNQCCCGGEYVSWHVVLYIIYRKQLSILNAVGFLFYLGIPWESRHGQIWI